MLKLPAACPGAWFVLATPQREFVVIFVSARIVFILVFGREIGLCGFANESVYRYVIEIGILLKPIEANWNPLEIPLESH